MDEIKSAGFKGRMGSKAGNIGFAYECSPTLCAGIETHVVIAMKSLDKTEPPSICYPINTMVATRGGKDDMRTTFGIGEDGDPQFTISAAHEHAVCYSIEGHIVDRETAQNGRGWAEGYAHTLNATDRHAVCCLNPVLRKNDEQDISC